MTGLDNFPLSVDFFSDSRIILIGSEFGPKGTLICLQLFCTIYGDKGYYCQWDDDLCALFTHRQGLAVKPGFVQEVVTRLVSRGIFSKEMYDRYQVLTSAGIQRRYFDAVRRRQSVGVRRELLLVDAPRWDSPTTEAQPSQPQAETPAPPPSLDDCVQMMLSSPIWLEAVALQNDIGKEDMAKWIAKFHLFCKCEERKHQSLADCKQHFGRWLHKQLGEHRQFVPPTVEEVAGYASQIGFQLNAQSFVDYYQSNGWRVGNAPMSDWQAAVRRWQQREPSPPKPSPHKASPSVVVPSVEDVRAEEERKAEEERNRVVGIYEGAKKGNKRFLSIVKEWARNGTLDEYGLKPL